MTAEKKSGVEITDPEALLNGLQKAEDLEDRKAMCDEWGIRVRDFDRIARNAGISYTKLGPGHYLYPKKAMLAAIAKSATSS